MKTGQNTNRSGLYISECCIAELTLSKGQMLLRAPLAASSRLGVRQTEAESTSDHSCPCFP